MSWLDKVKGVATSAGETAQRQARRARLEVAGGRIERRIRARKTDIGESLYPELKSGDLSVEHPDVSVAMNAIATLEDDLAANRGALEALKLGGHEDEETAADDADA